MEMSLSVNAYLIEAETDTGKQMVYSGVNRYEDLDPVGLVIAAEPPDQVLRFSEADHAGPQHRRQVRRRAARAAELRVSRSRPDEPSSAEVNVRARLHLNRAVAPAYEVTLDRWARTDNGPFPDRDAIRTQLEDELLVLCRGWGPGPLAARS